MTRRFLFLIAGSGLLGCGPALTGKLTERGYRHGEYDYQIAAIEGTSDLLPADWTIDNLYEKPKTDGKGTETAPKDGPDYMTTYFFDVDGDGKTDSNKKMLAYDLRYEHRVHSGVIWVRTVPISATMRDKDLRVLMKDYVDGVAGAGYERVSYHEVEEKRYAAETLSRQAGTVAKMPAFAANFAVANIDEVQVSKDSRQTQVRLVIVRSGFDYVVNRTGAPDAEFPVLLVLGYASQPEDYEAGVRDFDSLVQRVIIGRKWGVAWEAVESESGNGAAQVGPHAPTGSEQPPARPGDAPSDVAAGADRTNPAGE